MPRGRSIDDSATLEMALIGYQIQKQRIESKIQELRTQLKGRHGTVASAPRADAAPRKRQLSASARARIAAAQKRRWAEHRKRKAMAAKSAKTSGAKAGAAAS